MSEGADIMRAAGASEVWSGPRIGMHIMGGAVMGNDPAQSVTDAFGRVHDTENLYVAGPALFPSSGAVNPTFTLTAMASRQADHLLGNTQVAPTHLDPTFPAACMERRTTARESPHDSIR